MIKNCAKGWKWLAMLTLAGCHGSMMLVVPPMADCPIAPEAMSEHVDSSEQVAIDGADADAAAAAIADIQVFRVTTDADLALPESPTSITNETATVWALPSCGDATWYGEWPLSIGDSAWTNGGARGAIDVASGLSYSTAVLFQVWPGGAPLDAYGAAAGTPLWLELTADARSRVAEGSGVDPAAPHWTLWTNVDDGAAGDPADILASGPAEFETGR